MILIADGGSTKCDWLGCVKFGEGKSFSTTTKGMNPSYTTSSHLTSNLEKSEELNLIKEKVSEVYFFGSGCGEGLFEEKLSEVLKDYFVEASKIVVSGDIQGAVYSCTNEPGVVAILGTGSNICFYDGKDFQFRIPSMGYTLMDQGSGNAIGKKLLRGYFFKKMPEKLCKKFSREYNLDVNYIKSRLYDNPSPSSYLASLARFCYDHIEEPYMNNILVDELLEFFDTSVNQYNDCLEVHPIHFVGSIAFHSADYLKKICDDRNFNMGNIVQRPIHGLFKRLEWLRANL